MRRMLLICVVVFLILCACGCSLIPIRGYTGTQISTLTYRTVDYMGGASVTHIIDFDNNRITRIEYLPYAEENQGEREEVSLVCEFTEEAEREFINAVYSYGLFSIRKRYEPLAPVMDGGGWQLTIDYVNGRQKMSSGSNAAPALVFKNCAIPFYELSGVDILGRVPSSYRYPPNVDFSLSYSYNNHNFYGNEGVRVNRANYLWNEHKKSDANIYELATEDLNVSLLSGAEYTLSMYTTNYNNYSGSYSRFDECVVKSYNIDSELTGEREILRLGWFDSVKIPYEANRIYVVTLYFDKGDFVEYVFCTATLVQKIQYGEYHYNIYQQGRSVLTINEDGSFSLEPFDYFDESDRKPAESKEKLVGKWIFEIIEGREFLVLISDSGEKLVLDYCAKALFVDAEKSTLNLEKYNLIGNTEYSNGEVYFSK